MNGGIELKDSQGEFTTEKVTLFQAIFDKSE